MEVITIESEAFQNILKKLNALEEKFITLNREAELQILDNEGLMKVLGVSNRTLQKYRDEKLIRYSMVYNKIYYRIADVKAFLDKHSVNPSV